jgi:heme/copper-type cytochrome/quinol oxidase subunit 3
MPAKTQRAVLKTALLVPGGSIVTWATQLLAEGDYVTGAIGLALGAAFFGAFVLVQEYSIPYEEEIVTILGQQDPEAVEETAQDVAEDAADRVEDDL